MAFTVCEMKYQLQFTLLFLVMVGSGHLVTPIRPAAGPVSRIHPSSIHPNEVGGKDGCKLTLSELSNFPGRQVTAYIWLVKNKCKSCVAENVILEIRPKNPEDGYTSQLSVVSQPILPGKEMDNFHSLPTAFQIAEISIWNVQYVC